MKQIVFGLVALALTACGGGGAGADGAGLSDAQRVWCSDHDLEREEGGNYGDGAVVEAALTLGLAIPDSLTTTLDLLKAFDRGEAISASDVQASYSEADLREWRTTSDYERACLAAYEGR